MNRVYWLSSLCVAFLLLWFVTAVTIEGVFSRNHPDVALAWWSGSADGNARLASEAVNAGRLNLARTSAEDLAEARERAQTSLMHEPVNVVAARTLADIDTLEGHEGAAQRMLLYAESLSRHDFQTQIGLAQVAMRKNDMDGMILHFDRALRTSNQARDYIFPILLFIADLQPPPPSFVRTLSGRPRWWRLYTQYMIGTSRSPRAIYNVVSAVRLVEVQEDRWLLADAIRRLSEQQAYGLAYQLFLRAQGDRDASNLLIRDGDFEGGGGLEPFDWGLRNEAELNAARDSAPAGDGTVLSITARNGRGGDVASQLLLLPPGNYALSARSGSVAGSEADAPRIVVRCAGGTVDLLNHPFPASAETGRSWGEPFSVPERCPTQIISIRAVAAGGGESAARPWVDDLQIARR